MTVSCPVLWSNNSQRCSSFETSFSGSGSVQTTVECWLKPQSHRHNSWLLSIAEFRGNHTNTAVPVIILSDLSLDPTNAFLVPAAVVAVELSSPLSSNPLPHDTDRLLHRLVGKGFVVLSAIHWTQWRLRGGERGVEVPRLPKQNSNIWGII